MSNFIEEIYWNVANMALEDTWKSSKYLCDPCRLGGILRIPDCILQEAATFHSRQNTYKNIVIKIFEMETY